MAFLLNSYDLKGLGIIPGRAPGGNTALAGCFDMPSRIGVTSHDWDESDGTEPFVTAEEIMFSGRDISFYGSIFGTSPTVLYVIQEINTYIETDGLLSLETPYADMNVYVKNISVEQLPGAANVIMNFREPVVILDSGTLPATGTNKNQIDGIPLISFGLYSSKKSGLYDLPELKDQHFTRYGEEGCPDPSPKRKSKTLSLTGFIVGSSLADFQSKIKALYKIFSSAGTRTIKLNNEVSVVCFATEGFKVSNVLLYNSGMIASFDMRLIIVSVTYL